MTWLGHGLPGKFVCARQYVVIVDVHCNLLSYLKETPPLDNMPSISHVQVCAYMYAHIHMYIYIYMYGTPPKDLGLVSLSRVFSSLFCLVDFVAKWGGGLYAYIYIYIYMCAYIGNVSKDINICHLTEFASISEYWDNPGLF